MENSKRAVKGTFLFHEGDKIDNLYLIQQGQISLVSERGSRPIEVCRVSGGTILGLGGLSGLLKQPYGAEVLQNTTYSEMSIAQLKPMIEGGAPFIRALTKGWAEEEKVLLAELKTLKAKEDSSPCPDALVPRVFGGISLIAHRFGSKVKDGLSVEWPVLKTYAIRWLMESPLRLEGALQLLKKLNLITMETALNDKNEEELARVTFSDIGLVDEFADFFQYQLYRPGKSEIIHVESTVFTKLWGLVQVTENEGVDRHGAVRVLFDDLTQRLAAIRVPFKAEHLANFERKGLFFKRSTIDDKVYLLFNKQEFQQIYTFWRILFEIRRWNETGVVDDKDNTPRPSENEMIGGGNCPSCGAPTKKDDRFCSSCGHKLS